METSIKWNCALCARPLNDETPWCGNVDCANYWRLHADKPLVTSVYTLNRPINPFDEVWLDAWRLRDAIACEMAGIKQAPPGTGETQFMLSEPITAQSSFLTLDEYQAAAGETAIYPGRGNNLNYPMLGLCGEAGELANEAKKIMRDDNGELNLERRERMIDELGDVLWYVAMLAEELIMPLGAVAARNIQKLRGRKQAGTIHGSGGDR